VVSLKTRDFYGRVLAFSITTILSTKFIWNFLMNLGLMPHASVGMPFISFGKADFIVNMALVGLMKGIYRRRTLKDTPAKISGHSPA
jgi:cell division protein FtsW (lipid II flippase)